MAGVVVEAPAKVNLRLRVLARESGGYHGLETLFCAISLGDAVRVEPGGPGIALRVEGAVDTGPPERNLVVRAAERFYRETGFPPAVRVELVKRVPSAAGLGGGSSDAAATLLALNALHGEPATRADLLRWSGGLGSDVPFFLCGSPLALAWSRGERLLVLPALPVRPVLVAHPGLPLPTPGAFARIAERRGGDYHPEPLALAWEALTSWEGVATLAVNDFEPVADERMPRLAAARRLLAATGAQIAMLSGSGAAVFGIFATGADLAGVAAALRAEGFATWRTATLERVPEPRASPETPRGPPVDPGSGHG
jgi:4-diphosphocytidyl-2-C-methyl-D-erythritol kinase